jgi:hypothetical protein
MNALRASRWGFATLMLAATFAIGCESNKEKPAPQAASTAQAAATGSATASPWVPLGGRGYWVRR